MNKRSLSFHSIAQWAVLATLLAALTGIASPSHAQASPQSVITPEQQAQLRDLLGQFRRVDPLDDEAAAIVDDVLQIGEYGGIQLAGQLSREIRNRQSRYLRDFERQSVRALRGNWPSDVEQQVESLQQTVLRLANSDSLTREMIETRSDPAMERLGVLMSISREQVLESDSSLAQAREQLVQLVDYWNQAFALVPEERQRTIMAVEDAEDYDAMLTEREAFAAAMAMPMTDENRQILITNYATMRSLDPQEHQGLMTFNFMRVMLGLNALTVDVRLCNAARGHSQDMVEHNFFSHESPVPGKRTVGDRGRLAGTSAGGENIHHGSRTGDGAIRSWWYSPGHHRNMLRASYNRVGLGRHERHWTQKFGR